MIDEKAKSTVAKALYEAMEGPVSNQDFARQQRQWESAQALAVVAIEAYESAKLKEAEGWVLVPKEPSEEQIEAMVDAYRTTRRPGVCGMTIDAQFRAEFAPWFAAYRAMLSAAGDKE